ncbi:MAG: GNAT family N-acetyltransferase [Thermoplasmata archaeon]|nr:GNAT family N-acetyltransferase [Thermoplasmata archaeon]
MSPSSTGEAPRLATSASEDELMELLQTVRRELSLREEDPTGRWVEEAAADLRAGRLPGWYYPPARQGGGVAFGRIRGPRMWGHVHASDEERSRRLGLALLGGLAPEISSVSLGFTGLTVEAEQRLTASLLSRPGATLIERYAMERALRPEDTLAPSDPPQGLRRVPVRDVTIAALADLDWRAFRGTTDDLLVGGAAEEYARVITGLLSNGMGLFLDAASTTLVEPEPLRVVAGILTSEASSREAVFLDLMVDPERRQRGYARFLLRWSLRALRGLGYEKARLWVTAGNTEALRLYESEGFRRVAATAIYRWERPPGEPQPQRSR